MERLQHGLGHPLLMVEDNLKPELQNLRHDRETPIGKAASSSIKVSQARVRTFWEENLPGSINGVIDCAS